MDHLRAILDAQRAAFMAELPISADARNDRLRRAAAILRDHADKFCEALSGDFGHRSHVQTMMADIAPSVAQIAHARKNLRRWMKSERRPVRLSIKQRRSMLIEIADPQHREALDIGH